MNNRFKKDAREWQRDYVKVTIDDKWGGRGCPTRYVFRRHCKGEKTYVADHADIDLARDCAKMLRNAGVEIDDGGLLWR